MSKYGKHMRQAHATRMHIEHASGICRREENRREQRTNEESFYRWDENLRLVTRGICDD